MNLLFVNPPIYDFAESFFDFVGHSQIMARLGDVEEAGGRGAGGSSFARIAWKAIWQPADPGI